jgi:hypothetical protein
VHEELINKESGTLLTKIQESLSLIPSGGEISMKEQI